MKKLFLLLLWPLALLGADGDITGVSIEANGWIADIYIADSGSNTNGTLANGLGVNNALTGTEKLKINLTSCGYDDTGSTTTVSRVVYGTKLVRFAYPNNAYMDTTNDSGTLVMKVALSDYVFQKDVIGSAALASGLYATNSFTSAASTWSTVTNGSSQAYFKVLGNNAWPSYDRITGFTYPLRFLAFHHSAQQGRPVQCVYFALEEAGTVTNSIIVTQAEVDNAVGDATPVVEYVGRVSTSGFTAKATIKSRIIAYPRIGDSGSVLDTGDGTNTGITPLYSPLYHVMDAAGTYAKSYAVVDPVDGNDTNGRATNFWNVDGPPVSCLTMARAATLIAATNNTYNGHNDVGGGIVYLKSGNYNWSGASGSYGNNPSNYITFKPFPGVLRSQVIITNTSGDKDTGGKVKFENVTFNTATVSVLDDGSGSMVGWLDKCSVNCNDVATFYRIKFVYLTACDITLLGQGIAPFDVTWFFARGNNISGFSGAIKCAVFVGNYNTVANAISLRSDVGSAPYFDGAIWAYNRLLNLNNTSLAPVYFGITVSYSHEYTNGCAFVQNVFEQQDAVSTPLVQICADGSTKNATNFICWHNSINGQRFSYAYNDYQTLNPAPNRIGFYTKNNIFNEYNCVTDIDPHGGTANGARTNNWSVNYGVGNSGNIYGRSGVDKGDFIGFNTIFANLSAGQTTYYGYRLDKSNNGDGSGNGDYHATKASPATKLPSDWVLPYDIEGRPRKPGDAAGAYTFSDSKPISKRRGRR